MAAHSDAFESFQSIWKPTDSPSILTISVPTLLAIIPCQKNNLLLIKKAIWSTSSFQSESPVNHLTGSWNLWLVLIRLDQLQGHPVKATFRSLGRFDAHARFVVGSGDRKGLLVLLDCSNHAFKAICGVEKAS